MFVMTMKLTRKKAVLIILAIAVLLAAIVLIISAGSRTDGKLVTYGIGLKSNEERVEYLKSLGWAVDAEPLEERTIVIPREFSDILLAYNELQIEQGFDLGDYAGMEVQMYTYSVTNYPANSNVLAQLLVYNGQVIGGDIHSTALDGFMHGIK